MTGHRVSHYTLRRPLLAAASLVGLLFAAPAQAQGGGRGFLFEEPRWTFALRGGFDRANAGSDLFDFVTDELTLERSDFSSLSFSTDLSYSLWPRVDVAVSAGYMGSKSPSESRDFIGTDDLPIVQSTRFVRVPLTVSMKGYLAPRGQSIGSLAWIPSRFAPYVGVGGGLLRYKFEQDGEFVDSESANLDIFRDRLVTKGTAATVHGLAGLDFALSPHWGLTSELKYSWARGEEMGSDSDFLGFERIDLSGLSATMGLHVRF